MTGLSIQGANLLTLVVIVLLPIIPAYLLFKLLPRSEAGAQGPFQGLQIKLGGAFAGYFLVLLLVLVTHNIWAPAPVQVWHFWAEVTDEKNQPIQASCCGDVSLSPREFDSDSAGAFSLTFVTSTPPGASGVEFPYLTIFHDSYYPAKIPLNPSELKARHDLQVHLDEGAREIKVTQIKLQPLPTYTGDGPPLAPVTAEGNSR